LEKKSTNYDESQFSREDNYPSRIVAVETWARKLQVLILPQIHTWLERRKEAV